jgi:hypothetical protein
MLRQIAICLSVVVSPLFAQSDKPTASNTTPSNSEEATICEVAAHPAKYQNKIIRVQGDVRSYVCVVFAQPGIKTRRNRSQQYKRT